MSERILAPSNADALERARQMLDRYDLEVWCDGSRVGTVYAAKRV
jgi:threonine aldolase